MHKWKTSVAALTAVFCIGLGTSQALATTTGTVTVKPGDTFWIISRNYGISVQALEAANPSVNPNDLLVGSVLHLPGASTSSSTVQQQNLYWMEHVINAEATGESLEAQIGVGDVVLHRLESGGYGSTVHDVVFQVLNGHYQFTSAANGYIYSTPSSSSIQAAIDVLQKGEDVVPGAMVFYNPAKTPTYSWVRSQPFIAQIDNFIFAR